MSVRKGNDVLAGGTSITIDNALSVASVNPVQNVVVTTALNTKADASTTYNKTEVDSALASKADASDLQNYATVSDMNTALAGKQDTISAGNGINITDNTISIGNISCGTLE